MADNTSSDVSTSRPRLDLSKPRYDQSTYMGRAKHFFISTNPLNIFVMRGRLHFAKQAVDAYTRGEDLPFTDDEMWRFKALVDSAFHPDTGELMFVLGRMSAQVPMNMLITGAMMHWRTTPLEVFFWQWVNQSFNAVVNYTNSNQSGQSTDLSAQTQRLGISYVAASAGAVTTAIGLNKLRPVMPAIFGRFVPFMAVAAANCINLPIMRSREVMDGIPVFTDKDEYIGESKVAAKTGITQVVFSRIAMASPAMVIPPLIMQRLEQTKRFRMYPWLSAPATIGLVGIMLILSTPLCCALFPQTSSIPRSKLEPELQAKLDAAGSTTTRVFFNKGL